VIKAGEYLMKNFFKFLFIFTIISGTGSPFHLTAQGISKKGLFNIGVEGGVRFTNIREFSPIYQVNSRMGYSVGAFMEYFMIKDLKIHVGAFYDNRAFQLLGNFPFVDSTGNILKSYYLYQVDYKLNYLTLPISIQYQRGSEKFKVILQGGLYFSLFLGSTMDGGEDIYIDTEDKGLLSDSSTLTVGHNSTLYSGNTSGIDSYYYSAGDFRFSTYDFGFNLLIGLLYNVTPQLGLTASVGFSYSVTNLFEDPEITSRWSQNTRLNIGVLYTFKNKSHRKPSPNKGRE